MFGFAGLVSYDLTLETDIRSEVRRSIHKELVDNLDLAEQLTSKDLLPLAATMPSALLSGAFPVAFDDLHIDIRFKHLEGLKRDRARALERTFLADEGTYPAQVSFDGHQYRARIRLKGDFQDHWSGNDRWSLRVVLRKGGTIYGMSRFSLQRPATRAMPNDHLFQNWLRQAGNLTPRHKYVRVFVNGTSWGIMNVEEHMSKHFLELANKKEAPILRFNTDDVTEYRRFNLSRRTPEFYAHSVATQMYNDGAYLNDPRMLALFSFGVEAYRRYRRGDISVDDLLDQQSFTTALLAALTWKRIHTLPIGNSRFYLNPFTLKFEIITTDQPDITSKNVTALWKLYDDLVSSADFDGNYHESVEKLDATSGEIEGEYRTICEMFPLDCPSFNLELFRQNFLELKTGGVSRIKSISAPPVHESSVSQADNADRPGAYSSDIEFPEHIKGEHFDDGRLTIYNLVDLPVDVLSVTVTCNRNEVDCMEQSLITAPIRLSHGMMDDHLPARVTISGPRGVLGGSRSINIVSEVPGYDTRLVTNVSISHMHDVFSPMLERETSPQDLLARYPFASMRNNTVHIAPGTWRIDKPLVLPEGVGLELSPDTSLSFDVDAYILIRRAAFIAKGSPEDPIEMAGHLGKTWKGILVLESPEESVLSNVTIRGTTALNDGALRLTGGVTFYQSDVQLKKVAFVDTVAEDALNIVESSFLMNQASFSGNRSDAFDSDFSDGKITNSTFERIGGDGVDFSGSNVSVRHSTFIDIGDKAVSVGEASTIEISDLQISDVGTGFVSKDGSSLKVLDTEVEGFELFAGMAYRKKDYYGDATLQVVGDLHPLTAFFNQTGNDLVVNGEVVAGQNLDVDRLYSDGPMKKFESAVEIRN